METKTPRNARASNAGRNPQISLPDYQARSQRLRAQRLPSGRIGFTSEPDVILTRARVRRLRDWLTRQLRTP